MGSYIYFLKAAWLPWTTYIMKLANMPNYMGKLKEWNTNIRAIHRRGFWSNPIDKSMILTSLSPTQSTWNRRNFLGTNLLIMVKLGYTPNFTFHGHLDVS